MAEEVKDLAVSELEDELGAKEHRRLKARREHRSVWLGLGMFGLVGWSVVVPALAGTALGWWLDKTWPNRISWTITLLVVGLFLGCMNAWRWIGKEGDDA